VISDPLVKVIPVLRAIWDPLVKATRDPWDPPAILDLLAPLDLPVKVTLDLWDPLAILDLLAPREISDPPVIQGFGDRPVLKEYVVDWATPETRDLPDP